MTRTWSKVGLKFLLVGLLAVALVPTVSFSQSNGVAQGKFTLSFEAHWGKLNLQPGTYSFAVRPENSSYVIAVTQGGRHMGFVLASVFSPNGTETTDHALLCVRHAAACSVGALKMPDGVFYFQLPSSEKAQLAQQPDLIEQVPVLFAER